MSTPSAPRLTAAALAAAVGGELRGDGAVEVSGVAPLDRATSADVSFLGAAKYADAFATTCAGVVLLSPELAESVGTVAARVIVAKPQEAMLALLPQLYPEPVATPGTDPTARIAPDAVIGADVAIGPYVVIESGARVGARTRLDAHCVIASGAVVGEGCHLYPHVTLYGGARVGDRVRLHSGVRVGSDGFGYVFGGGAHQKIPHVGRAIIESDVEIGANCTIDRGSIDDTVIGAGTKLDNLVHVGHNVRIGRLCLLMAQVGVAGSARIEDGVILAGQSGVAGHLTIGAQARVAAQAGVISDVAPKETVSGMPARPHREMLRGQAATAKLAEFMKRVERFLAQQGE
ncbi:MAG: UDP-3-O-(3-hydroxymyristoyl)glucosamine N-acyltransferase [Gemmatimonadaceae bacterium]|nr:UDP-3-O-(3-hydroxymyristoyl)glucosamine N-acyltransferase [Gemmatimonadaceae bacterium]